MGLKQKLGLERKQMLSPEKMAFGHGLAVADMTRSQSDLEDARLLGINLHMINDDTVNAFLEGMAIQTQIIGKDKVGKPITIRTAVPKYAAVYIARSSLIRTSIIDPLDAQIGQLETRCLLRRVCMSMTEEESEGGGRHMIDAVKLICDTAWLDAQGGNKAKMLKVSPKSFEVSFRENKNGEGGYSPK